MRRAAAALSHSNVGKYAPLHVLPSHNLRRISSYTSMSYMSGVVTETHVSLILKIGLADTILEIQPTRPLLVLRQLHYDLADILLRIHIIDGIRNLLDAVEIL